MMKRELAIIGIGPRGLYAVENLLSRLSLDAAVKRIHLLLFEETGDFGNGQVYDSNQVKTNWINISERILCLDRRPTIRFGEIQIPSYPSYHEWSKSTPISADKPDNFPPRAKIGEYLQHRFKTLADPMVQAGFATLLKERVVELSFLDDNKIVIKTDLNTYEQIDEVLLTIGHQETQVSKQMSEWQDYFSDNEDVSLVKDPYPLEDILKCKKLTKKSTIGLRGFGLATIDVVRGLATRFGEFQILDDTTRECKYNPSVEISNMLIPFSPDGLPPSPKPLNARIDKWYEPTEEQISDFESKIGNPVIQKKANSPQFLIDAIAPIVAKIYSQLSHTYLQNNAASEVIVETVKEWLKDDKYEDHLVTSQKQTTQKTMAEFVGMATGKAPISLDFCVGQVWRHCQPTIYQALSFNGCADDVFAEILQLDERLKRYSYGPPVESIQQMLALISAGVMTLEWVKNPEIDLSSKGWKLECNGAIITTDMMINSVLDSPEIKAVISPLVKSMLSNDLIEVVHDDFGVLTNENGYLMYRDDDEPLPIALLGRLAKGTIIGVDAILECFGRRPEKWASEAADNYIKWLERREK